MKHLSRGLACGLALVAVTLVLSLGQAAGAPSQTSSSLVDIQLTFDTTGSMGPSLEQAKQDGRRIIERVRSFIPNARFAVVSFRDFRNQAGEYQLLQPMTNDVRQIQAALDKLVSVGNSSGGAGGVPAESYSLMYQRSYSDSATGWRPAARKIVVVVGDAEPHGAGTAKIEGCSDTTADPHGLNPATELARMRAAGRTLVMIRQVSQLTTSSLGCYAGMAALAAPGGAARDSGRGDLAQPVLNLITRAYAPVEIRADLAVALPGARAGYTLRLQNPNRFNLRVRELSALVPPGLRYQPRSTSGVTRRNPRVAGRRLTWPIGTSLRPRQTVALHFVLRVPAGSRRAVTTASATVDIGRGEIITTSSAADPVRVTRTPRGLTLGVSAGRSTRIRGAASLAFGPGSPLAGGRVLRGNFTVGYGAGRQLRLAARGVRVFRFGAPTDLELAVEVTGSSGFGACANGTTGRLLLRNSGSILRNGLVGDELTLRLGGSCRSGSYRWSNARSRTVGAVIEARAR
ncbi:MAG: VWA domain-containing protein [Actinobacteria bacterium]|nr:VWA domain-containing protein [Actinomycetota bacterium]